MLQKSLAKRRLKKLPLNEKSRRKKFKLSDAREALARQQPMPVRVIVDNSRVLRRPWYNEYHPTALWIRTLSYYCQCCGGLLGEEITKIKHVNYCPDCGQKQWWR